VGFLVTRGAVTRTHIQVDPGARGHQNFTPGLSDRRAYVDREYAGIAACAPQRRPAEWEAESPGFRLGGLGEGAAL